MTQPEALRLADALQRRFPKSGKDAAAELRRLHEAHDWQHRLAGDRLRRIEKLEAVNQELLDLLKRVNASTGSHTVMWQSEVRAAIAKAENS